MYDPDPLSRAGTLLYRLYRVVERLQADGNLVKEPDRFATRFLEVVEKTGHTRANSFADDYLRVPKWVYDHTVRRPEAYQIEIPLFWYVLTGKDNGFSEKTKLSEEERERTLTELELLRVFQVRTNRKKLSGFGNTKASLSFGKKNPMFP